LKLSTRRPVSPTYAEIGAVRSRERTIGRHPKSAVADPLRVTVVRGKIEPVVVATQSPRSGHHDGEAY
jgi:hypothetical protein